MTADTVMVERPRIVVPHALVASASAVQSHDDLSASSNIVLQLDGDRTRRAYRRVSRHI